MTTNGQRDTPDPAYAVVRRWQTPHGLAIGVSLPGLSEDVPAEALARLHPDERAWTERQPPRRRVTWVGGRLALREALRELGIDAGPIFATPRGAPLLPPGIAGSLSHKAGAHAVALVDRQTDWCVGVDLELLMPPRPHIARKILTTGEQERLAALPPESYWREVIVRFSVKEAIYKALDPFVRRYVDFDEVEIEWTADGATRAVLTLSRGEGPFVVETYALVAEEGAILTTARVRRG